MTTWTQDELATIGGADELQFATLRRDGSLRKPVTIWVVRHGDDLYVRSYNGRAVAWFRRMAVRHEGFMRAGDNGKEVTFEEEINPGINDQAVTIKLVPRATRHS